MAQIKISTLFAICTMIFGIFPLLFYQSFSVDTVMLFSLFTFYCFFVVWEGLSNIHEMIENRVLFLCTALIPFLDFIPEWLDKYSLMEAVHMPEMLAMIFLLFRIYYAKKKFLNYIILGIAAISVFCLVLILPVVVYQKLEFHHEKQLIKNNDVLVVSTNIPEERLRTGKVCRKYCHYEDEYFVAQNVFFKCKPDRDNMKMDKFLCHDVYQYAGKNATVSYILRENHKPRLVQIFVEDKPIWLPSDTLRWYQKKKTDFWRRLILGLFLISLPSVLLYFWAGKIVIEHKENEQFA